MTEKGSSSLRGNFAWLAALAIVAALLTLIVVSHHWMDATHPAPATTWGDPMAMDGTGPDAGAGPDMPPKLNEATLSPGRSEALVKDNPLPSEVLVLILDEEGESVAGLDLKYWGSAMRNPDNKLGAMRSDEKHPLTAVTDAGGRCRVPIHQRGSVTFHSASEDWQLGETIPAERLDQPNTLIARRLVRVFIDVVVDDGRRWVGRCAVNTKRKGSGWSRSVRLDGERQAELKGVLREDLVFYFSGSTVGVEDSMWITVPAAEILDLAVITLTLKADPDSQLGVIEFDFTGYGSTDVQYEVAFGKPGSRTLFGNAHSRPGLVRSTLLYKGEYVVKIAMRSQVVWESEVFEVRPREVTRVTYANYLPATIHVSVVNELDEPIRGAVLTSNADTYVNFAFASEQPGVLARTNGDGAASLTGQKPGSRKFLVEAEGYEAQTLEVELAEGEVRHLPPVQLRKAIGMISVKLTEMKPGQGYIVMLLQPGGSAVRIVKDLKAPKDETEVSVRLEALPARTYTIAVVAGLGGKTPPSEKVVLDAEHTFAEISFDVSELIESSMSGD